MFCVWCVIIKLEIVLLVEELYFVSQINQPKLIIHFDNLNMFWIDSQ